MNGLAQKTPNDVCRHLLHHVDRVVDVQLFDYACKLGVGDGVYDALLLGRFKVCENLGGGLLGKQSEHHGHSGVIDLGEKFGDVKFVELFHAFLERFHVALIQKLGQLVGLFVENGFIVHCFHFLILFQQTHLRPWFLF